MAHCACGRIGAHCAFWARLRLPITDGRRLRRHRRSGRGARWKTGTSSADEGGVINVGGAKVHPEEVEAVLNAHAAVRASRAYARKNPVTGAGRLCRGRAPRRARGACGSASGRSSPRAARNCPAIWLRPGCGLSPTCRSRMAESSSAMDNVIVTGAKPRSRSRDCRTPRERRFQRPRGAVPHPFTPPKDRSLWVNLALTHLNIRRCRRTHPGKGGLNGRQNA